MLADIGIHLIHAAQLPHDYAPCYIQTELKASAVNWLLLEEAEDSL